MAMMNNVGGGYGGYQPQVPSSMPLIWVENEMEARNTYVPNGNTVFFMERNNQRMYAKSVAMNGIVDSFRIFEFTEVTPPPSSITEPNVAAIGNYVTKDDLQNVVDTLKAYMDDTLNNRRNNYRNKGDNHG